MLSAASSQLRWSDWLPEPGHHVDVLALGRSGDSICARLEGSGKKLLVSTQVCSMPPVPGELFTVTVTRRTRRCGLWLLEGPIRAPRLVESVFRFEPLALVPHPEEERRERPADGASRPAWELAIVEPRVPGFPTSGQAALDEITRFWEQGDVDLAEMLVGELLARDLRCLEAHALLGGFFLNAPLEERWTERALRHFRVGAAIGELSLGSDFEGCLPWRWPGNRGLLRCLYGYARCLQRVGDGGSAADVFRRLLTLAPEDPMRVREVLAE